MSLYYINFYRLTYLVSLFRTCNILPLVLLYILLCLSFNHYSFLMYCMYKYVSVFCVVEYCFINYSGNLSKNGFNTCSSSLEYFLTLFLVPLAYKLGHSYRSRLSIRAPCYDIVIVLVISIRLYYHN